MNLNDICLRRLRCWIDLALEPDPIQAEIFKLELGQLGFRVRQIDRFTATTRAEFELGLMTLSQMRGDDVKYVPLFNNFPDDLPNDRLYLMQRVLGWFGLNTFGDRSEFGADPVTQMQSRELWDRANAEQERKLHDLHTEWIEIEIVDRATAEQKLARWATDLLYSATPVKEQLWSDIFGILDALKVAIDSDRIAIKETLARLAADRWEKFNTIAVKTPTDLLRMLAFTCGQDVSLAKKIDFKGLKLSKPQRRAIVGFLNACPALGEDFLRYRGLWISLSKWLHPGDLVGKFPKVAKAFDDLRNDRLKSFESQIINAPSDLRLERLLTRPSLLLRKLTWLLKDTPVSAIIAALNKLDPEALPLPLLMSVYCAIKYDGVRLVINKKGKYHPLAERQSQLDTAPILETLDRLIINKLTGTKDWDTVWIDPAVATLVLPLQARKQSDGLLNLARGSWFPVDDCEVIRLFVYWQEREDRTDLDLSAMQLSADFSYLGHVGWNDYGDGTDIAHSGDIQSAPIGAAEFIDLRLNGLESGYIMPAILRFTGENFTSLAACNAGWMKRQSVSSDVKTFDAQTVSEKVTPHIDAQLWIPFLLDVAARQIIYVDLYVNGGRTIESNPNFPTLAAALARYWQAKPTYADLADWYVRANHATITDKENANISIGITDDCTINVLKLAGEAVTELSPPEVAPITP